MRVLSGVLFVGAVVWTHLFVDGVNLCNARNGFGGDRRIATLSDLEELAPQVA